MTIIRLAMIAVLAIVGLFLSTVAALAYESAAAVDLNVRSGPGTSFGVVDVLYAGEPVEVTECASNGWCYIVHSGPNGWVSSKYLSTLQVRVQRQQRLCLPHLQPKQRSMCGQVRELAMELLIFSMLVKW